LIVETKPFLFQLLIDEWLEELEGHDLRKAGLMQTELRTDNDDGAAGVIDAFSEKVLAETALFALEHIGERTQRPLVRPRKDLPAATVVEQGVHRLL
jgi:hypothetical protein